MNPVHAMYIYELCTEKMNLLAFARLQPTDLHYITHVQIYITNIHQAYIASIIIIVIIQHTMLIKMQTYGEKKYAEGDSDRMECRAEIG